MSHKLSIHEIPNLSDAEDLGQRIANDFQVVVHVEGDQPSIIYPAGAEPETTEPVAEPVLEQQSTGDTVAEAPAETAGDAETEAAQ